LKNLFPYLFTTLLFLGWALPFSSQAQSISGTTGLFHTPTARMMPDKTVNKKAIFRELEKGRGSRKMGW
jgi:hypothetical protein